MSCWLLHVVLAAVTNGQNNLLESSDASCCGRCSRAQGSAAGPWHRTGSRVGPDGQRVSFQGQSDTWENLGEISCSVPDYL